MSLDITYAEADISIILNMALQLNNIFTKQNKNK